MDNGQEELNRGRLEVLQAMEVIQAFFTGQSAAYWGADAEPQPEGLSEAAVLAYRYGRDTYHNPVVEQNS